VARLTKTREDVAPADVLSWTITAAWRQGLMIRTAIAIEQPDDATNEIVVRLTASAY
jgi:hypothetical protein